MPLERDLILCTSHRYAHRDIKSENILIDFSNEGSEVISITGVRLIDFGLICGLNDPKSFSAACGSRGFMAPECLLQRSHDARKLDIWSLGCVMVELLAGTIWFELNWLAVCKRNQQKISQAGSLQAIDQFLSELKVDVKTTIEDVARSSTSEGMLKGMLVVDPFTRMHAQGILEIIASEMQGDDEPLPASSCQEARTGPPFPQRPTTSAKPATRRIAGSELSPSKRKLVPVA